MGAFVSAPNQKNNNGQKKGPNAAAAAARTETIHTAFGPAVVTHNADGTTSVGGKPAARVLVTDWLSRRT